MATPYNVHNNLWRAMDNVRNRIDDPGAAGEITFSHLQIADAYVTLATAGTYTFESAARHPLHTELTVYAQAAVTANTLVLADGEFATWRVILDSDGDHVWALTEVPSTVASTSFDDDSELSFGDGDDAVLGWETGDASNHTFVVGLGDSNQALHITDKGAISTDWNVSADTHPTVYIHSNTTPATDYLLIGGHDGTTAGIDVVGGTTLDLRIAGTDVAVLDAGGFTFADNVGVAFGTGDDAVISWDATNLVYDVDSGVHNFTVATTSIAQIGATGITLQQAGDAYRGQGSNIVWMTPAAAQQDLTGAGAITITEYYTAFTSDGTGNALTLADGAQVGQVKKVVYVAEGAGADTGIITPDNLAGGSTVTLNDTGDEVEFLWNGTNWVPIVLIGAAALA